MSRIAIVDSDRCKPKKCGQECRRNCPVVHMGKECIKIPNKSQAEISENLCIGCGLCVKKCPMKAIKIVNLPQGLEQEVIHRYGPNSFQLHRLPEPRTGQVVGLLGSNGIGKSTALKILSGKITPNLGDWDDPPDRSQIVTHYRGSALQNYFKALPEMKIRIKPQHVDQIARSISGKVSDHLKRDQITDQLQLDDLMNRPLRHLSGGELQRFALAKVLQAEVDIYLFDEPSSYLDIKQRMIMARLIRDLAQKGKYVVIIEHDLAVLDYVSDLIYLLYGTPSSYGVFSSPFNVREGINIFLSGFLPTENLRFRDYSLDFNLNQAEVEDSGQLRTHFEYPETELSQGSFNLKIQAGSFSSSQITVLLGENGTGKTSFIRKLRKRFESVSYKPQTIHPTFSGTVQDLFLTKIRSCLTQSTFISEVMRPLGVEQLYDRAVSTLSGGELQKVGLVLALGRPAQIYLIDEPSAHLDSESRVAVAKVLKRFTAHHGKSTFVVEHDMMMSLYLADQVVVFSGSPSVSTVARSPCEVASGMNYFLSQLNVTLRRDTENGRPRINKYNSTKDKEQKGEGRYIYLSR